MATDCYQFMSSDRDCWGVVADFMEDRNGCHNFRFKGVGTDPVWEHGAILNPSIQVALLDGSNGVDNLTDALRLTGKQRKMLHEIQAKIGKMLRIGRLYALCSEFRYSRKLPRELPSDLSDADLAKCLEILGKDFVQKEEKFETDLGPCPRGPIKGWHETDKKRKPNKKPTAYVAPKRPPQLPTVIIPKTILVSCPRCKRSENFTLDYRDPDGTCSVICPCIECQQIGDSCLWLNAAGCVIKSIVIDKPATILR